MRQNTISVLVVDDHPLLRHETVAILEREPDITVVGQADSAASSLHRAQELLPTVVLLDVNMPGNGLKAARSIAHACPTSKVVMLTTANDPNTMLAAMEAGACGYLLKGRARNELAGAIRLVAQGDLVVVPAMAIRRLMEIEADPRSG
ncbi:MAG: response regulator transcription factor [Anaerolineales bacterium]